MFMARLPVVADTFYPGNPTLLTRSIGELVTPEQPPRKALAAVVPHAGYVYSGNVVGQTLSRIIVPETVLIAGPNHTGYGAPVALGTEDWAMPMGHVRFGVDLAAGMLQHSSVIVADNTAHQYEHSLEVQIPFLQFFQKKLSIVPLVISHISYAECEQVAEDIAQAITAYEGQVLLVASTDMTHYESREEASLKDQLVLKYLLQLDPRGVYTTVTSNQISMCGVIPTTIILLAARCLGAQQAELVKYTDSGEVSGDTDQVVGYAGVVIR